MTYLIEQLINGICQGAIYALFAIGYTIIVGVVGLVGFIPLRVQNQIFIDTYRESIKWAQTHHTHHRKDLLKLESRRIPDAATFFCK